MLKTIKKSLLAVVLTFAALFTLASCNIFGNSGNGSGTTTTDPTLDAQTALNEFTAQVTFADMSAVTSDFNLVISGKKNSYTIPITWTSSNSDVIAIADLMENGVASTYYKQAKVTRPAAGQEDATVTLTADFSLTYSKTDGTSATLKAQKTYTFKVLANTLVSTYLTEVETGVPYRLAMTQQNASKVLYMKNAMSGYYVATSEDINDGVDAYLETVEGGYHIYFLNADQTKTYISAVVSGTYLNCVLKDSSAVVWTWDETYHTLTTDLNETKVVMGTHDTYQTVGIEKYDEMSSVFPVQFYTSPTSSMTEDEKNATNDAAALTLEDKVEADFNLLATGVNGSTITWTISEGNAISIEEGVAKVTRTEEDQTVKLTATITSGDVTKTKEFTVIVKGNVMTYIELTDTVLGLSSYADGTKTVEGVEFGYTELSTTGNGIQMRNKTNDGGKLSSLWNNTAFPKAIKNIVLVFNAGKNTYDNNNVLVISFGNDTTVAAKSVDLNTVAGTKTYTITPDAETYTFFKLAVNSAYTYSSYWDSITINFVDGTSTPVTPTHTHTVCETCGKCTAEDCPGTEDEKCPGHTVEPAHTHTVCETCGKCTAEDCPGTEDEKCAGHTTEPAQTWQVATSFEADKAYKLGFYQEQNSKHLYLTGDMKGYYGATTEDAETAADVYAITVEGGYKLKVVKSDATVTYIALVPSGNYNNFKFVEETAASVFTYDAEKNTFVTLKSTDNTKFFMGTYGTNVTFGMSNYDSYIATSYVSHFYALATSTTEPVTPTHTHTVCETCGKCTAADCPGTEDEKCAGHTVEPTHTHTVCETCGKCTAADCPGTEDEKCAGHTVEPTHTHTVCETCGKCTAADCPGTEDEKCPGHSTDTPVETLTVTLNYTAGTTTNMVQDTNNAATLNLDATLFNVNTNACGSYANKIGLNKDGSIRLYASKEDGEGNELTIKCNEGTIKSITITFGSKVGSFTVNGVEGAKTTTLYEINSDTVIIKNTTTGATTQLHIQSIEIIVEK